MTTLVEAWQGLGPNARLFLGAVAWWLSALALALALGPWIHRGARRQS